MHPFPSPSFCFASAVDDQGRLRLVPRRACLLAATFTLAAATSVVAQPGPVQPNKPEAVRNAPAVTEPSPSFAPVIERLVSDLGSPIFSVREQASSDLAAREDLELREIELLLARPELSPEQRIRLQTLARERFASTPRGAMGVRFGGVLQQSRIVIDRTYEGFAAHDLLKAGDVIVEAEGRPLRGDLGRYILRAIVFAHDPGDTLPITVRRGAETLHLTLQLGSFRVLAQQPQGSPLDELDLTRAWAMRTALRADAQGTGEPPADGQLPEEADAAAPIVTSLPAGQWPTMREQLEKRFKLANARLHGQQGERTIVAGGQFRQEGGSSGLYQGVQFAVAQPTHPLEVLTREPTIMPRERELTILASMELRTTEELERLSALLESAELRGLPQDQRAQSEELLRQYRERLKMIKMERAAIEAEQHELGDEEIDDGVPLLQQ